MGFAGWGAGWLIGGRDIALAGVFCGITPTAIAAPVIISFLKGRVDFVVAAFLITNVAIAALMPFILPIVLGRATPEAFAQVLGSVGLVVFVPMALANAVRLVHPRASEWPMRLRNVSFGVWVVSMFLITSNGSAFVRAHAETPHLLLFELALISILVCAGNFILGKFIGGREFSREGSQSLGPKNTTLTIYLALTYASPLVALGPTCYVLWHNLWNSWQLHRVNRPAKDGSA